MPPPRKAMSAAEIQQMIATAIADHEASKASGQDGAEGGSDARATPVTAAKPCTYKDFLACKPQNFNGTEGAVGLIRWFEKIESVFRISNCAENCRVKFATCTLQDTALTWWNAHAQSVGIDAAYQLPWEELKLMMRKEYCPRHELQQIEEEFWKLTVKGTDLTAYTNRFHQLAHLCPSMVEPEFKKIERYIWGLPEQVQGGVISADPITLQDAIRIAHNLMAPIKRRGTVVEANTSAKNQNNKRKWNDGNPVQQQASGSGPGTESNSGYKGRLPFCNRCNRHHTGPCGTPCGKCKRYGHQTKDCRSTAPVNNPTLTNAANQGAPRACFECGLVGHFRNNCPKLKEQDTEPANGRVYLLTNGEDQQDLA